MDIKAQRDISRKLKVFEHANRVKNLSLFWYI